MQKFLHTAPAPKGVLPVVVARATIPRVDFPLFQFSADHIANIIRLIALNAPKSILKAYNKRNNTGLTLIESLVSVALLSLLLISILGAFYISRLSTERAKHRIAAMNTIRQYMETEIKNGYLGGAAGGDYYVTVDSAGPVTVVIDDRNTPSDTSDDLMGRLWPKPYPAGALMEGASRYKLIGFVVDWKEKAEDFDISGSVSPPWEMAAAYVAEHR